MLRKNIANIFTILRIILALILIFEPVGSNEFYIIYSFAVISDMVDGFLARKLKIESQTGEKLDSIADLITFIVASIKIFSYVKSNFTDLIIILVVLTLIARMICALKLRTILLSHSVSNKIIGIMLFPIPYLINFRYFGIYLLFVCALALAVAFYELYLNMSKHDFKY